MGKVLMPVRSEQSAANLATFGDYYDKSPWWFRWRYDTQIKRKTCLALLRSLDIEMSGKNVFDLGFGSGDLILSFQRANSLYGLEISQSAVARAMKFAGERGFPKYTFTLYDGQGPIPLPSDEIDVAIASHVLEHMENLDRCLSEIYRILKPGGAFVVLIPVNERFTDPHHVHTFTMESCKHLCAEHGFGFHFGFENELLFYLVEKMYRRNEGKRWGAIDNARRLIFNVATAPLPFWLSRLLDRSIGCASKLPPRQAALAFTKESNR
jgi:ubiquinone/menaquinone biosynthesis C-methylase UbiE